MKTRESAAGQAPAAQRGGPTDPNPFGAITGATGERNPATGRWPAISAGSAQIRPIAQRQQQCEQAKHDPGRAHALLATRLHPEGCAPSEHLLWTAGVARFVARNDKSSSAWIVQVFKPPRPGVYQFRIREVCQFRIMFGAGSAPGPGGVMAESDWATRGDGASPVAFVRRIWLADAGQLASIRSEVRRWLGSLGMVEDDASDVVFAVSEAASNAVDHAYRRPAADDVVEVTFWTEGAAIFIEIVDHGQWRPPVSSELSGRGRGIPMMRELMDAVVISYDGRGTRVLLRHVVLRVRPEL